MLVGPYSFAVPFGLVLSLHVWEGGFGFLLVLCVFIKDGMESFLSLRYQSEAQFTWHIIPTQYTS